MNRELFAKKIAATERQWLNTLYRNTKEIFSFKTLPSHDHTHHLRVWMHARDLLCELFKTGFRFNEHEIILLMVSVFFHDTGLTITYEPDHGKESRKICEQFLSDRKDIAPEAMHHILEAIEWHDDKSYIENRNKTDIYALLSVADDLDAYGAIGVYRYFEIYKLRGIREEEIPGMVIDNLEKRFGFLEKSFGHLEEFIHKQRIRKLYTADYYKRFINKGIAQHQQAESAMQVLNILMNIAFEKKNGLDFLLDEHQVIFKEDEKSGLLLSEIKIELQYLYNLHEL